MVDEPAHSAAGAAGAGAGFGPREETRADPETPSSARGPWVLGVLAGVMAAFSGVVWSAYHQGVREGGRTAAPVIRALEGPFKVKPQEAGGAPTPHLDKEVFSRFDGPPDSRAQARAALRRFAESEGAVDQGAADPLADLAPFDQGDAAPLEPSSPPARREPEPAPTASPEPAAESTFHQADVLTATWRAPAAPDGEPRAAAARASEPAADEAARPRSPSPAPRDEERIRVVTADDDAEVAAPVAQTAADPSNAAALAPARASPPPPPVAQGGYAAQLGSYRSRRAADVAWDVLNQEAPGLFTGRTYDVTRADLGERGVFYRLRVPGFAERTQASAYCDQVLERGYGCIVAGR